MNIPKREKIRVGIFAIIAIGISVMFVKSMKDDLILATIMSIGMIGFSISFTIQFLIKFYISKEKVDSIDDPMNLYPNSMPPKIVLNEKGLKLYRLMKLGGGLFAIAIISMLIKSIYFKPLP